MIDLGEKWSENSAVVPMEKRKSETHYPYLDVNKDIGLDEEDVGKTITATVKLKVKSVEKRIDTREGEKTKKTERSSFDVLAIGIDKKDFADAVEAGVKK